MEEKGQDLVIVRRRADRRDLSGAAFTLAEHLIDKRLLVSSESVSDGSAVYEVGHEAVFSHWKRFKGWYELYASDLALRRQAERAVSDREWSVCKPALRWGWELQKPAIDALRKLNQLTPPQPDRYYIDPGIAVWRTVEAQGLDEGMSAFLYPEPLALIEELNSDETYASPAGRDRTAAEPDGRSAPRCRLNEDGLPDISRLDIPAGEVTLEGVLEDRFRVEPFRLARYPVTWAQYPRISRSSRLLP